MKLLTNIYNYLNQYEWFRYLVKGKREGYVWDYKEEQGHKIWFEKEVPKEDLKIHHSVYPKNRWQNTKTGVEETTPTC